MFHIKVAITLVSETRQYYSYGQSANHVELVTYFPNSFKVNPPVFI